MKIAPFGVELWMNEFETRCTHNLAETCVASLSVRELLDLAGLAPDALDQLLDLRLTYGAIEGSDRLRDAVAALYATRGRHDVLITHGAIGANALVHQALVSRGDTVIAVVPAYQQHYSIPEALGAHVKLLPLREETGWLPDLDELRALASQGVRLIALTNPNNPTGSLLDAATMRAIADIAAEHDAYVLADEVYRGIDQEGDGFTASITDLYERGISTGSMSKPFSLAGLRLGWVVGPREVIEAVAIHRDYTTISVGMIDDLLAALALEHADALLARSRRITRESLAVLDAWVSREPRITYVKPRAGTTALLKYDLDLPSRDLCVALLERTGVMLTPGSALGMEGYLRIGYAIEPDALSAGLALFSEFLSEALR